MPGGRSRSANAVRAKRSPVPRGPRNHLRPVAVATSQPMRSTSTGTWPTLWQASRKNGTPARRHAAPASSTGLIRPRWVPMWVRAASATPPRLEGRGQRLQVDGAVAGARHHLDGGAGQFAHLEQSEVVAVVGDPVGQQALAPGDPATEDEAPQGLGPPLGVRTGDHHVTVAGAEQPGRRRAERGQALRPPAPPPRTRPAPTRGAGGRPWRRRWPGWGGRHRRC